jgi:small membrane protein
MIVQFFLLVSFSMLIIYSLKLIFNGHITGIIIGIFATIASVIVIVPEIAGQLANLFGVGRGADLLLYLSFAIGMIMFLHVISKIHTQDKKITELVRFIAITQVIKKK